ncbi:MAG: PHP domain-containing protein, partial [Oscillospiraceae bacterium]
LYRELFVEPGGSCFVPVEYTDMYEAAHAARLSGGVVVLAHPDVYDSFDAASRLAQAGLLDGLECDYPRHRLDSAQRHWVLVEQYGLIPTGGTDFHGFYGAPPNPIGTCGVETNVVARLRKAVGERMQ